MKPDLPNLFRCNAGWPCLKARPVETPWAPLWLIATIAGLALLAQGTAWL